MKNKEKEKITFLDIVIPVCSIYISGLLFWGYFIDDGDRSHPFLDVIVIFISSTFFVYGVFSFIGDLMRYDPHWIIKSWWKIDK